MIHALANEQDIRKYGGFKNIIIQLYTDINRSLALIGNWIL
jgi:uncharacterized protein YutE (UPF0331/DUF86 family)